jgi:hypothetical protein
VVASAIVENLSALNLDYPSLTKKELKELENAKQALLKSG